MTEKILKQIAGGSIIISIIYYVTDKGITIFSEKINNCITKTLLIMVILLALFRFITLIRKFLIYFSKFEATIATYKIDNNNEDNIKKAKHKGEDEILQNEGISVAEKINNSIADGNLYILVSNNLFGDPSIGYKKKLWLYFYVCGTPIHITTPFGENYLINFNKTIFWGAIFNFLCLNRLIRNFSYLNKILLPKIKDDKGNRIILKYNKEGDNWVFEDN